MPTDAIVSFFSTLDSAIKAREEMDSAVKYGQTSRYHQQLREVPHVRYLPDLKRAKHHLDDIVSEIHKTNNGSLGDDHKALYIEQLRRDMNAVAQGTLDWLTSKLQPSPPPTDAI